MFHGLAAVLLSLVPAAPAQDGKELVAFVEKLGGTAKQVVFYDKDGKKTEKDLYRVDLKGKKVSDEDLRKLAGMKGLHDLDVSFTQVTDKGVEHLAGAKELTGLDLMGTRVTDAAIPHLRAAPQLSYLKVAQTGVTAAGAARFAENRSCDVCWLAVGDKGRFRVHQTFADGVLEYNFLMINDTHFGLYLVKPGAQGPDRRREAATYYHRGGPVGQVMAKLEWFKPSGRLDYRSDARLAGSLVGLSAPFGARQMHLLGGLNTEPAVAVLRLNVGTVAAYGRPFQDIHIYNSTPEIKTFSLPPKGQPVYFGYVRDALERGCRVQMIDGPERESLKRKMPKQFYSALFVDLARNDLRDVMTELMTQEALADLMGAVTEKGVVCFHTSHRYQDLPLPIIDAAKALHLSWKVGKDIGEHKLGQHHFSSEWVVVARKAEYLQHLVDVKEPDWSLTWTVPDATGKHLWRDGQPQDLKALTRPPVK